MLELLLIGRVKFHVFYIPGVSWSYQDLFMGIVSFRSILMNALHFCHLFFLSTFPSAYILVQCLHMCPFTILTNRAVPGSFIYLFSGIFIRLIEAKMVFEVGSLLFLFFFNTPILFSIYCLRVCWWLTNAIVQVNDVN